MGESQDTLGTDFAPSVPSGVKPDAIIDAAYNRWLLAGGKPRDAKDKLIRELRAALADAERERDEVQRALALLEQSLVAPDSQIWLSNSTLSGQTEINHYRPTHGRIEPGGFIHVHGASIGDALAALLAKTEGGEA